MTPSVTSGGLQQVLQRKPFLLCPQSLCMSLSLCLHRRDLPCKGIFPLKSSPDTSFQNSLSHPAGPTMNLFCFASSAQMKGYFSSAIYALKAPIPHCKAGLGFLSFTAFLHTTYPPPLWGCTGTEDPFYTSRSFRKFRSSHRIDFIQHSYCKECQLKTVLSI